MSEINAIATNNFILHNIDAKKLYVQEPLFTANSGDAVYVGWRPDETVLFENWDNPIRSTTATGSLTEPLTSFDSFEVTWAPWGERGEARWEPVIQKFPSYPSNSACYYPLFAPWLVEGDQGTYLFMELLSANDTNFCIKEGRFYQYTTTVTSKNTSTDNTKIFKIVGINRKENA